MPISRITVHPSDGCIRCMDDSRLLTRYAKRLPDNELARWHSLFYYMWMTPISLLKAQCRGRGNCLLL